MRKIVLYAVAAMLITAGNAYAAVVQYIGTGKPAPSVKVTYSRNNGSTWESKEVKPGQTFAIPKDATHLQINNVPRNPKNNYKVKDGNIF